MNVRMLSRLFQAAAVGTSFLSCLPAFAADHRIFPTEPQRPHVSAACRPNWGFNQTCWQRFPELPPCDGQNGCMINQSGSDSVYFQQADQQMLMNPQFTTPQLDQSQMMQQNYSVSPVPDNMSMQMVPSADMNSQLTLPPTQQLPPGVPMAPDQSMRYGAPQLQPTSPVPGGLPAAPIMQTPGGTPPLPPLPEPAQSRVAPRQPDYRGHRSSQAMPAPQMTTGIQSSRYGQRKAPVPPAVVQSQVVRPNTAKLVAASKATRNPSTSPQPTQPIRVASQNAPPTGYPSAASKAPVNPATSTRYAKHR